MKYKVRITNHIFGVPTQFFHHHDSSRFLLLGVDEGSGVGLGGGLRLRIKGFCGSAHVNGSRVYRRVFIRFK